MVIRCITARHPIYQLRDEMDRLLSGAFPPSSAPLVYRDRPAVNVWEDGESLKVEMETPGVKSENFDISVIENELRIKVEIPEEEEKEGVVYHRRERASGSFTRVVPLPFEVDAQRVSAELSNGVLLVTLPKTPSVLPRKIEVQTR